MRIEGWAPVKEVPLCPLRLFLFRIIAVEADVHTRVIEDRPY